MLKHLTSPLAILLLMITGLALAAPDARPYEFLSTHSILHLVGWALVPRIMFFFFSIISGGLFFWIGVILIPRIMVAYWATVYYWDTNMFLCVVAWVIAIMGEVGEKVCIGKCRK
jgi:hypothetical protein